MTVSYLDVDDEITNAVARLRAADDLDVLLVLPPGSHIATSRINFRLLAREARDRHKRLAIASGESGTRAVAVSAGLPAFASVDEWQEGIRLIRGRPDSSESSPPDGDGDAGTDTPALTGAPPTTPGPEAEGGEQPRARAQAAGPAQPTTEPTTVVPIPAPEPERQARPRVPARPMATPSTLAGAGVAAGAGAGVSGATAVAPPLAREPIPGVRRSDGAEIAEPIPRGRTRVEGAERPGRRRRVLLAAVLGVLAVFLALGGAAAYVLLPTATVRIRPQTEVAGPVTLTIRADPSVLEADPDAGVIPAQTLRFPLEASGTFESTGVEVTETNAEGRVVFENLDPSDENTIPAGAVVATDSDVRFATVAAITVPASTIEGRTVVPGRAEVGVRAVTPGPAGNVAANAIRNVPANENPALLEVHNPAATAGGSRSEKRFVEQADYDAALAQLEEELDAALAQTVERRDAAPEGLTLFTATAERGETTAEPAADAVVGEELEEFQLRASAEGTALAVDESTLEPLAAERLTSSVPQGWELFPESVQTSHDEGQVGEDGTITFAVRASAEQWRPLDGEALRAEIRGLPIEEARQRLSEHGEVEIESWPSFVTAIPTIDSRLQIEVLPPSRSAS